MAANSPVYLVTGGVSRLARARPDKNFQGLVKEAYDYALNDIGLDCGKAAGLIDGMVTSYFSDQFTNQLMAGIMVQDYLGLVPKPGHRVEGGGATGGICLQEGWKAIASGYMDVCVAAGFETMSRVNRWKANEIIALASDTVFDYPVGGFYTGYYAMMVVRHMMEFGTKRKQLSMVAVKNRKNALHNPFAQNPGDFDLEDIEKAQMVSWPLTYLDICTMSDGAALVILASEKGLDRLEKASGRSIKKIRVTGIGRGTDMMRMADRPRNKQVPVIQETAQDSNDVEKDDEMTGYPGVHSCRAGRLAAIEAYRMAGIENPLEDLDFVELHDAFSSSEIQCYEDLGLCNYGEGGKFVERGLPFMPGISYQFESSQGIKMPEKGRLPVNPSGGLIACGHPIGATGLMQGVFALWQLQGTIGQHFKDDVLQVRNAKRGAIHSHAGTGTYVAVTVIEAGE
ncbi:MAG: thiolase domain-containing protein [Spirochaetota bacterium]|nr:thiolase domain-containing protein [Spirochaetota bacterium]